MLLDPYARDVLGGQDGIDGAFKARVADDAYDWGDDRAPRTPPEDTILYEMHVKGFTRLQGGVPEALRGSYAGLAHPAALEHLDRLGVTAVSLLPLQRRADEAHLARSGLSNHWGYSTVGFFVFCLISSTVNPSLMAISMLKSSILKRVGHRSVS